MKVEVTLELDINLLNASIQDVRNLIEEMVNPKEYNALESVTVKDVKIGV